jgi:phage shock protein PspC (stress-responsive transcriptional regulator)
LLCGKCVDVDVDVVRVWYCVVSLLHSLKVELYLYCTWARLD